MSNKFIEEMKAFETVVSQTLPPREYIPDVEIEVKDLGLSKGIVINFKATVTFYVPDIKGSAHTKASLANWTDKLLDHTLEKWNAFINFPRCSFNWTLLRKDIQAKLLRDITNNNLELKPNTTYEGVFCLVCDLKKVSALCFIFQEAHKPKPKEAFLKLLFSFT